MRKGKERGDARTHRVAHHVGACDREVIEQSPGVLHHGRRLIGLRLVKLLALTVSAVVVGDHAVAIAR